jgi:molybdate transport system substrate-binding protein
MDIDAWLRRIPLPGLLAMALMTLGVACGDDASPTTSPVTNTATPARLEGTLTVFAASSLTEAFKAIGAAFTAEHPDVTVEFNNASSSALATQIEEGAPADVFASADMAQMQRLVDGDVVDEAPATFARNLPVIVVPAANEAGIAGARDLAKSGVKLVLAAEDVPIGNYSRQILDRLAEDPEYGAAFKDAALANIVSNEANVRAVLTKIELGEGDAGIVYKTDALVSGDKVRVLDIPAAANVFATYPISVVTETDNRAAAEAFVAFVSSDEGQAILADAGFDPAP